MSSAAYTPRWVRALLCALTVLIVGASLSVAAIAGITIGADFGRLLGSANFGVLAMVGCGLVLSIMKSALPAAIADVGRENAVAATGMCLVWLGTVAYCSLTAISALIAHSPSALTVGPSAALLAAGWVLIEASSGILVMTAAGLAPPPERTSARGARPYNLFQGDVGLLLDHLLIHGTFGRPNLAITGPNTITCTQAALADHACCSKTEANRQLWQLHSEGRIALTTTRWETRIEVRPGPLTAVARLRGSYDERRLER